jgi:tRNA(Ile2)-agmatinylcytidine synthase
MLTEFHIGIDDTDSKTGGCTTYTAALLFEEFCRSGFEPTDFPWLVRLNPNIPWKTRGNGALAIHVRIDETEIGRLEKIALEIVEKTTDPTIPSTDPALVFLCGQVPAVLRDFSTSCDRVGITRRAHFRDYCLPEKREPRNPSSS